MATITPSHVFVEGGVPHDVAGVWEYSVPLENDENAPSSRGPKHNSSNYDPYNPSSYAHQSTPQTNGQAPHNNRDSARDADLLVPTRLNNLRNKSSDLSNGSEQDSLLDLYKAPSNPSMRSSSGSKNARKVSGGALSAARSHSNLAIPEEDASKWIHRDKLAQIESRELIEAGLRVGRRPSERFDAAKRGDEKRQKLSGAVPTENVAPAVEGDENAAEDALATPSIKSFIPKPAGVRGANSRIPLPKSVSGSYGELPGDARSRSGSAGVYSNSADSGGASQSPQAAAAGYEYGDDYEYEQALEDSPPDSPPRRTHSGSITTPTAERAPSSPQKQGSTTPSSTVRNPKNAGARRPSAGTTGTRNTSASAKARGASNVKGAQREEPKRPGTSSGNGTPSGGRPMTSHRTDGEPPWLATMYKPDPRLPPDQQMLPTHAKRLAQEQWEKEGKTGTVYDKEFRLLNTNAFPSAPPSPERKKTDQSDSIHENGGAAATLLRADAAKWRESVGSPRSHTSASVRPGTSGTESGGHGGYKTMPSVPTLAAAATTTNKPPTPQSAVGNGQQQQHQQIEMQGIGASKHNPRAPLGKKEEKEAGCAGCGCVIM